MVANSGKRREGRVKERGDDGGRRMPVAEARRGVAWRGVARRGALTMVVRMYL